MTPAVQHDRGQESIEAKTRWFRSLSMGDRIDVFCSCTDLALSVNPNLKDRNMLNRLQDVFKSFQQHDVRYVVS